jgi:glycosyltransferase involved in cell wall biosynthesis
LARGAESRNSITYVGRLHVAKNLHRLLPVIRTLLKETPGLRVCIIGEGEQRAALEEIVGGDAAFHFTGVLDSIEVRDWLRRTRIFISGCEIEALGICYLEALSQGCAVVMPASGGGLEVALDQIGKAVHLLPLSFDPAEVLSVLRRALDSDCSAVPMSLYSAEEVAKAYLRVDSRFSTHGTFAREGFAIQEGI